MIIKTFGILKKKPTKPFFKWQHSDRFVYLNDVVNHSKIIQLWCQAERGDENIYQIPPPDAGAQLLTKHT